jgi:outer membrane protein assembly factor BamB
MGTIDAMKRDFDTQDRMAALLGWLRGRMRRLLPVALCVFYGQEVWCQMREAWVAKYPIGSGFICWDGIAGLSLYREGGVVVAGYKHRDDGPDGIDLIVLRYSPDGRELWSVREDFGELNVAHGLGVDGAGNIYLLASTGDGCRGSGMLALLKLDGDGRVLWNVPIAGSVGGAFDTFDNRFPMNVDTGGDVLFIARVNEAEGEAGALIRHDPDGREIWRRILIGKPSTMAVGPEGAVFVAGKLETGRRGFFCGKYGKDAEEVWLKEFTDDPAEGSGSSIFDMAIDREDTVYLTGRVRGQSAGTLMAGTLTVKLDALGEQLWSKVLQMEPGRTGWASRVAVIDSSVYVGGYAESGVRVGGVVLTHSDYLLIKYDSGGNELWSRLYDGPGQRTDYFEDLALDGEGRLFVTGCASRCLKSRCTAPEVDDVSNVGTLMYDPNGELLWEPGFGDTLQRGCGFEVVVDPEGNVYVAGGAYRQGEGSSFVTIKYLPDRPAPSAFRRGDANSDGRRSITDAVVTLLHLFAGRAPPPCAKAADTDDSGRLEVADVIALLSYLFQGTSPPAAPSDACGPDPTPDDLGCEAPRC